MKVGIDSYCYHRFFGEVYPEQPPPPRQMSVEDFLARAQELGVDGVSLESCFLPSLDLGYLRELKAALDEYGFERVYAWGHPDGLQGGRSEEGLRDMIASLARAEAIGARVMRVVGGTWAEGREAHAPQLQRLAQMFRQATEVAKDHDVRMAVENHNDFTADELLRLLETVNSPYLGINFDTGNFVRLLDDPVEAARTLGQYVYATHIKDVWPQKRVSPRAWYFFSSAPVGQGLIDIARVIQILNDAGYAGMLTVEIDFLHPDYGDDEDAAVADSVRTLRRIASSLI